MILFFGFKIQEKTKKKKRNMSDYELHPCFFLLLWLQHWNIYNSITQLHLYLFDFPIQYNSIQFNDSFYDCFYPIVFVQKSFSFYKLLFFFFFFAKTWFEITFKLKCFSSYIIKFSTITLSLLFVLFILVVHWKLLWSFLILIAVLSFLSLWTCPLF